MHFENRTKNNNELLKYNKNNNTLSKYNQKQQCTLKTEPKTAMNF